MFRNVNFISTLIALCVLLVTSIGKAENPPSLSLPLPEQLLQLEVAKRAAEETDRQLSILVDSDRALMGAMPYKYEGYGVRIFYGTSRTVSGASSFNEYYGGRDGTTLSEALRVGTVEVNIPPSHKKGHIERPYKISSFAMKEAANKHMMLVDLQELSPQSMSAALEEELAQHGGKAFLYIHGYFNSFTDAATKAAQIAVDAELDMVPIIFSWPSRNQLAAYFDDYEAQRDSAPRLQEFVQQLVAMKHIKTLHIIAHSMGNDLTLSALQTMPPKKPMSLGELVLAAPDVDQGLFRTLVRNVKPLFPRITTYVSSRDRALQASHAFRTTSFRAGDSEPHPLVLDEMITIDVSAAKEDWLGHSLGNNVSTLKDLYELMLGKKEAERVCLKHAPAVQGVGYWLFWPHSRCNQ